MNEKQDEDKAYEPEIVDNGGDGPKSAYERRSWGGGFEIYPLYMRNDGCLSAFITLALFFFCMIQYGLLAAIGFFVFHIIASGIGLGLAARQKLAWRPWNPWLWRICSWIGCLCLTVWLAGGFKQ